MATIEELGQRVKAKYPGVYDDLSDTDVGTRVRTRYPDAYKDFTTSAERQATLQTEATAADKEASRSTASRFATELPKQAASTLLRTPARFVASAAMAPFDIARQIPGGQPSNYQFPLGIGETFQSQAAREQQEIVRGERPLIAGLKPFAQVPAAGLETMAAGSALKSGAKAASNVFSRIRDTQNTKFLTELLSPLQSAAKGSPFTKALKGGRVQEGGFFSGRSVSPDASTKAIVDELKTITALKKGNTALKNTNIIHHEIGTAAKTLRSQLEGQQVMQIVDPEDINALMKQARADIAENPVLVGDASKTATKILDKFTSFLPKDRPITPVDMLDARQSLDRWMNSVKANAFDPKTENAVSIALRPIRQGANDLIAAKSPDVAVKQLLNRQSRLYDAIEAVAPKAAREAGTKLGRFAQRHPFFASLPRQIGGGLAGAIGAGAAIKLFQGKSGGGGSFDY